MVQLAPAHRGAAGSGTRTPSTAGALAAASWLRDRGAGPPATARWHVEVVLDVVAGRPPAEFDEAVATRFHISVYSEEWGFFFCHRGRASWIRVTDIAFVHGRDDHRLLDVTPPLRDLGALIRRLEGQHAVRFQRQHAAISTNLPGLEPAIRSWVESL